MTSRQEKLIENYVRKQVRRSLKENKSGMVSVVLDLLIRDLKEVRANLPQLEETELLELKNKISQMRKMLE